MQVDCAWYSDDLHEVAEDPTDVLKAAMKARGVADLESACPECFDAQRRLWCAQTVPKCGAPLAGQRPASRAWCGARPPDARARAGSFAATVEVAVLPALTQMAAAVDDGQNHLEALGNAVPSLLNASSLAMPCRAMCEGAARAGRRPAAPSVTYARAGRAGSGRFHPAHFGMLLLSGSMSHGADSAARACGGRPSLAPAAAERTARLASCSTPTSRAIQTLWCARLGCLTRPCTLCHAVLQVAACQACAAAFASVCRARAARRAPAAGPPARLQRAHLPAHLQHGAVRALCQREHAGLRRPLRRDRAGRVLRPRPLVRRRRRAQRRAAGRRRACGCAGAAHAPRGAEARHLSGLGTWPARGARAPSAAGRAAPRRVRLLDVPRAMPAAARPAEGRAARRWRGRCSGGSASRAAA